MMRAGGRRAGGPGKTQAGGTQAGGPVRVVRGLCLGGGGEVEGSGADVGQRVVA
ncbi:hypothetical protein FB561_4138 [Kribbella amoyensis]|uniref:Uncharacterized protein n=1 Tax=Kribbella amoyensis TaxID=996641 RepID=A0A561BVY6_9ACTN|nr:hypothetical protein FB561_4138 [Kribbella amoyensis]